MTVRLAWEERRYGRKAGKVLVRQGRRLSRSHVEWRAGFFRETANPHVMEKVDEKGNVLGFSVMKVSALRDEPLEVAL